MGLNHNLDLYRLEIKAYLLFPTIQKYNGTIMSLKSCPQVYPEKQSH